MSRTGPAGVIGRRADRVRDHVLDPVLEAEVAVAELDRRRTRAGTCGDRPTTRCSASEQPRRRSKQIAGAASGGTSSTGAPRRPARLLVARDGALRPAVDHRRGHPPQVGEAAADGRGVEVGRGPARDV